MKELKINRNSHRTLNKFTSNLETLGVFIRAKMYYNGPIDFETKHTPIVATSLEATLRPAPPKLVNPDHSLFLC